MTATLLTLNIKGGLGTQLRPLTAWLAEQDADILCLQECGRAVVPWLQGALYGRWQAAYASATYNGNAVLSRFPLTTQRAVSLRVPGQYEVRSAVDVTVALPGGPLRLCCVHLDHIREDTRLAQWAALRAAIPDLGDGLLCGDLNAVWRADYDASTWARIAREREAARWEAPDSRLMAAIAAAGFADAAAGAVEMTSRFDTRIDYILTGPRSPWRAAGARTLPAIDTGITDHNGVMVRLEPAD